MLGAGLDPWIRKCTADSGKAVFLDPDGDLASNRRRLVGMLFFGLANDAAHALAFFGLVRVGFRFGGFKGSREPAFVYRSIG